MLKDLVYQSRSYRAFDESRPITEENMRTLVELARFVPSGMNKQPLRYRIVSEKAELEGMDILYSELALLLVEFATKDLASVMRGVCDLTNQMTDNRLTSKVRS